MKVELIKGNYQQSEMIELINQLFQVKINFLEKKIENSHNEEDIKMRENRIKELQKALDETRRLILSDEKRNLESSIQIN